MTPRWAIVVATLVVAAVLPATVFAQAPTEIVEYYATDAIGSVRVVFDASGNVVGRMDFTPFGGELFSGQNQPHQRFAGLFRDGEAGLDFAQARSYQVRTGRFTALDPIFAAMKDPQQWNRYAYARNSPTGFTDASGLQAQSNCHLGSYWCPSSFGPGDDVERYFDPNRAGYQGGEEMARAEAAYATRIIDSFVQGVVDHFSRSQENAQGEVGLKIRFQGKEIPLNDCTVESGCMKLGMAPLTPGQIGAAGERIVRGMAEIGNKTKFLVDGRTRIADGMLGRIITEIKNTAYVPYTQQLKDYVSFAAQPQNAGMVFELWMRAGSTPSAPLKAAMAVGQIIPRYFKWP